MYISTNKKRGYFLTFSNNCKNHREDDCLKFNRTADGEVILTSMDGGGVFDNDFLEIYGKLYRIFSTP